VARARWLAKHNYGGGSRNPRRRLSRRIEIGSGSRLDTAALVAMVALGRSRLHETEVMGPQDMSLVLRRKRYPQVRSGWKDWCIAIGAGLMVGLVVLLLGLGWMAVQYG
jgi:hypothetical protein